MPMRPRSVVRLAVDAMPSFLRQRLNAFELDLWIKGKQGMPEAAEEFSTRESGIFVPNAYKQTEEHLDLSSRSYTPWAGLVIGTLAQTMFLEGVRMPGKSENLQAYEAWQRNNMDAQQGAVYRGALGHGISFMTALPGNDRITGAKMPKYKGYSALKMAAFYTEDDEEFPMFAMACEPYQDPDDGWGWRVKLFDEEVVHYLSCKGEGYDEDDWTYIEYREHGMPVCPVVRYTNLLDLDGRSTGEIEPVIPLLKRIDQDTYDRLIVQRYGAWKVRYITGLVKPEGMTDQQYREGLLKLKLGDFLTAVDKDTKFGTLEETQLQGFIAARDADLRDLASIQQQPPHHMLGVTPQMQPESLASVNQTFMARSLERRTSFGESHERLFRLSALIMGNRSEAGAWDMQCRWRDTESRSLTQTADALGKIAVQLKVPVEMLWERIEGWTDSDTERAKNLIETGTIDQLLAEFEANGLLPAGEKPAPKGIQA